MIEGVEEFSDRDHGRAGEKVTEVVELSSAREIILFFGMGLEDVT